MVITGSFSLTAIIDGHDGAKLRIRRWVEGEYYLAGKNGEEFYDVVLFSNSKLYLCVKTIRELSKLGVNDPVTSEKTHLGVWVIAQDWEFVATKLLLAEKIKADQIDANGMNAKEVKIEGDLTAKTMTLKKVTDGSFQEPVKVDGSIILSTGTYELPELKETETRQIIYHQTQVSRTPIDPVTFVGGGNAKICINGDALTAAKTKEKPGRGTYLLLGHLNPDFGGTLWSIYELNEQVLDIPPRDEFDVVSRGTTYYNLPDASTHRGKIFVKLMGKTTVRSKSPIYYADTSSQYAHGSDGYYWHTWDSVSMFFISNGGNWYMFTAW